MRISVGKVVVAISVVGLVLWIWGGIQAYRFSQTQRGEELLRMMRLVVGAAERPGVAELRSLGCEQAVVLGLGELVQAAPSRYSDEIVDFATNTEARESPVVMCQNLLGNDPACEAIAATYAMAARPDRAFVVMGLHDEANRCFIVASAEGSPLGPFGVDTLRQLVPRSP